MPPFAPAPMPAVPVIPVDPFDIPLALLGAAPAIVALLPSGALAAREYMNMVNLAVPLPPKRKFKVFAKAAAVFAKKSKKSG